MTLQDAVDKQFYEEPDKRIIRAGNRGGWVDVHFVYNHRKQKLMVRDYRVQLGHGMKLCEGIAAFQMSDHTDWILV
jgi:hypothetical protein